jgi:MoaA/NifB/PqqE/SkfB family radical SAM enzyme
MQTKDKISAIIKVLKIKLLGERIPLVVTWPITNRCNFRCKYCERWKWKTKELSTSQVFKIIDELKKLGTIRISLSGGEPLVREDIGQIIDYAKSKGISVVLTSNGSLVSQKIDKIKNLDLLKLSVEGKEEVHDKIRRKKSFKKVLEAADSAQKQGIKFVFNSVLTSYNLDQINFLLSLAEKYKTGVRFTALNLAHAGEARIKPLYPNAKDYQGAIERLILAKKKKRPVLNSFAGLEYFKSWPKPQPLQCFAGRAFAHLSAEGKLYPCVILEGKIKGKDVLKLGLSRTFKGLPAPIHLEGEICRHLRGEPGQERCPGCWCTGTLELNLLLGLKPRAIWNLKKLI